VSFLDVLARKRDGLVNTAEDMVAICQGAANESVSDYQLTAWLMAAFLNGLNDDETANLTLAMARSGEILDLSGLPKPWLDKHSTGGVGDKTTIVLLPLLAACGLTVVKMSGRGLGITGGTIDKLSSIAGMRLDLTPEEMKEQAGRIGLALTGQTPRLAPADGRLYALRDVTGTVASLPLIVSSILSKKMAGGAEFVCLDVKCGRGAFMRTLPEATALARALESTGERVGLEVTATVTDMDQPFGRTIGNALEVKEAIRVLKGEQSRFADGCIFFAKKSLRLAGLDHSDEVVRDALEGGHALAKAKEWISSQGGDLVVFETEEWQVAPHQADVTAKATGWIADVDAGRVGEIALGLGAGRRRKTDEIDPSVGLEILVKVGDQVVAGEPIARVHARDDVSLDFARGALKGAVGISPVSVDARPFVLADPKV